MGITEEGQAPPIMQRVRCGAVEGWRTVFKMIKFVLPLYIVVDLCKASGVLESLGTWCAPFMSFFGLPGATAFAFLAGGLINLYAAIAVLAPLDLTPWHVTQCGVMMGIVCVWSIWYYLDVVAFGPSGEWVVSGSDLATRVIPFDTVAAIVAIGLFALGTYRAAQAMEQPSVQS